MKLIRTLLFFSMVILLGGCLLDGDPGTYPDTINLDIEDVGWAEDRPDLNVGWSGEAAIQMAAGYYEEQLTQHAVNAAGQSQYPDLHAEDFGTAFTELSMSYEAWTEANPSLNDFIGWIREQVRNRHPVVCGVKIYPDEHPGQYLDQFVLVVGFTTDSLIINTTTLQQQTITYSHLKQMNSGYSLANQYHHYVGYAITGVTL